MAIFIPVIYGSVRQGRQGIKAAKFIVAQEAHGDATRPLAQ